MQALDVVSDPVRNRIVELLAARERSSGDVTAVIRDEFGISQPAVSQHLKVLRDSGLASMRAEGTRRLYSMDRLSASYVIALAGRLVREVGELVARAGAAGKRLPTLSIDAEIRFASAADRAAFTADLSRAVQRLVAQYHDASAPGGRPHRLVVVAHPLAASSQRQETS